MTLDEARIQLRRQPEEIYGVDGAHILLDQPPGGWCNLVTNDALRRELAVVRTEIGAARTAVNAVRTELKGDMAALRPELLAAIRREATVQTWPLITAMIALVGVLGGLFLAVGRT